MRRPCGLSLVVVTRNDGWGDDGAGSVPLLVRAKAALWTMLETADEVVLVDMASPGKPMIDSLPEAVRNHARLTSIVVSAAQCQELRHGYPCGTHFHELLARNVGVDAAACDAIASTNIDDIPPSRAVLDVLLLRHMPTWQHAFTLRRYGTSLRGIDAARANDTMVVVPWQVSVNLNQLPPGAIEATYIDDWWTYPGVPEPITAGRWKNPYVELPSMIINPGDFQLARRELWRRVKFSMDLDNKRGQGDTFLQASWLNRDVTIHIPGGVYVLHIAHSRGGNGAVAHNPWPSWKFSNTSNGERILVNKQWPPVP